MANIYYHKCAQTFNHTFAMQTFMCVHMCVCLYVSVRLLQLKPA